MAICSCYTSYCYCGCATVDPVIIRNRQRIINQSSMLRWLFDHRFHHPSLLSYFSALLWQPSSSQPYLWFWKYFVIPNPFLLLHFVKGCVKMYYLSFLVIIAEVGARIRNLYRTTLGKKISLYFLLRLRKLLIETENKPKINLTDLLFSYWNFYFRKTLTRGTLRCKIMLAKCKIM